ncbi:Caltractin [Holothuria leucospilota]|uniref:Caltractin n=1 Tax=Holothuria leucospilota TaxID=206669 RepID=A0A9Q0YDF2_HOLLE|nr:Caltractin [Holothuria leucospilota]
MDNTSNRRGALFLHAHDRKEVLGENQPSRYSLKTSASKGTGGSDKSRRAQSTQPPETRTKEVSSRSSSRRPSTLPNLPANTTYSYGVQRRVKRHSVAATTHTAPFLASPRESRRYSIKPQSNPNVKPKTPDPEPGLTNQQKEAFKEVFDLFDSNGGGTIDADELDAALRSVDIHIPKDELIDVMQSIDKDGSGEIDFGEFLTMMTNTEKFLEIFAAKHEDGGKREPTSEGRETVLFDALTQFMKTSALKQMDEIVGYYNTKYKKAQAPHVVMHYAAGARLIGLTEKQLTEHLKKIQMSNSGNTTNPYAQPLYNVFFTPRKSNKKKRTTVPARNKAFSRPTGTGKIRLKICIPSLNETEGDGKTHSQGKITGKRRTHLGEMAVTRAADFRPKLAWSTSHVKSMTKKLPTENKELTTEDLPYIREKIQAATREYFRETAEKKRKENIEYWKRIGSQKIPSRTLRGNFNRCFRAYIAAGLRKT